MRNIIIIYVLLHSVFTTGQINVSALEENPNLSRLASKNINNGNIEKVRQQIFEVQNDIAKAYASSKKQLSQKNHVNEEEQEKIIAHNNVLSDLKEKSQKLELSYELNRLQQKQLFKTQLFLGIICFLLLIITVIAVVLKKANNAQKSSNKALVANNETLFKSKKQTQFASKLKENFYATISHELRTPLYAVIGITDMLIDDGEITQKKHLNTLKASGQHLLSLVNNILQINKYDAEKVTLDSNEFEIRATIDSIIKTLHFYKSESGNSITVNISPDVPAIVRGDAQKLRQVLINLLSNAIKFTSNGKIVLEINQVKAQNQISTLKISVADNGKGIPLEIQDKIFKDFFQESMDIERKHEGTGLGLSIVKRLLKAMGSTIQLKSRKGEGATFWFTIDLEIIDTTTVTTHTNNCIVSDLKDLNILVVDDNNVNLMITERILTNKKATVTTAKDGIEAIDYAKNYTYDIILMDIQMPNMNGYEATKKIRSFNTITPIIAFTALKKDEDKNIIFKRGMDGIIVKPFDTEKLVQTINKLSHKKTLNNKLLIEKDNV